MAEIVLGGKRLQDLKVTELKKELDKRGLQKKGVKSVLVDRLRKAILLEELTQVAEEVGGDEEEEEGDEDGGTSDANASQSTDEASQPAQVEAPEHNPPATTEVPPAEESAAEKPEKEERADKEEKAEDGKGGGEIERESGSDGGLAEFSTLLSPKEAPRKRRWRMKRKKKEVVAVETPTVVMETAPVAVETPPVAKVQQVEEVTTEGQDGAPRPDPAAKPKKTTPPQEPEDFVLELTPMETRGDETAEEVSKEQMGDDLEPVPMDEDIEVENLVDEDDAILIPDEPQDKLDTSLDSVSSGDLEEQADDEKEDQEGLTEEREDPAAKEPPEEASARETEPGSETEVSVEKTDEAKSKLERLASAADSVQFEPSYQPDAEELLYEGDVDSELPKDEEAPTEKKEEDTEVGKELGFVVDIHGLITDDFSKEQDGIKPVGVGAKPGPSAPASSAANRDSQVRKGSGDAPRKQSQDSSSGGAECSRLLSLFSGYERENKSFLHIPAEVAGKPGDEVVSAKVMAKANSRNHRFGYVTMATPEQGQQCIKELNGSELKGRKISVSVSKGHPVISRPVDGKGESPTRRPSSSSPRVPATEKAGDGEAAKEDASPSKSHADDKGGDGKSRRTSHGEKEDGHDGKKGPQAHRHRSRSRERRAVRRLSRSPTGRKGPLGGRGQRGRRRSRSPLLKSPSVVRGPGDARHDILRREAERRELMERRLGVDPYLRERERQVEMRLEERRIAHDRHQEMMLRRQLEVEHNRREQEVMRRIQEEREREAREREARERQLAEQERVFKERERELREREYRERQRREALERALREREAREREMREREKKQKEQQEREMREREARIQREREMRERVLRAQVEKERQLREHEQHLREEQERVQAQRMIQEQRRMQEERQRRFQEEQRRMREEQQRRAAVAAAKEAEEKQRQERERRLHEKEERERAEREKIEREKQERERMERERRERERKERQEREQREEERAKREREEREQKRAREREPQGQRLGKRAYSGDVMGFEVPGPKRLSLHESPRASEGSPSSVFGRLAPPTQKHSPEVSALEYRRAEQDYQRSGRISDIGGGYTRAEGANQHRSLREARSEMAAYPIPRSVPMGQTAGIYFGKAATSGMYEKTGGAIYSKPTGNVYGKAMSGLVGSGGVIQDILKQRSSGSVPNMSPEMLSAATQVLQNFQKTVASGGGGAGLSLDGGPVHVAPSAHLQQMASGTSSIGGGSGRLPGYMPMASRASVSGGSGGVHVTRYPLVHGPMGMGGVMGNKSHVGGHPRLPPEAEGYNRRVGRPPAHVRPMGYNKRLT